MGGHLSKGGVAVEGQVAAEPAAAKTNGQVSGVGIHHISIHTAHNAHLVVCCKCSSVNEETRSSACFFSLFPTRVFQMHKKIMVLIVSHQLVTPPQKQTNGAKRLMSRQVLTRGLWGLILDFEAYTFFFDMNGKEIMRLMNVLLHTFRCVEQRCEAAAQTMQKRAPLETRVAERQTKTNSLWNHRFF